MSEWWYPIVVPALLLRDLPGERQSARIDFDPPLELGSSFGIDFWFRTEAYARDAAAPVLIAGLRTVRTGAAVDLTLRLDQEHVTAELQNFRGPLSGPLPLNQWAHVALVYQAGELRLVCWQQGKPPLDEGQSVDSENESYRLSSLTLASENTATHLFAELRLRNGFLDAYSRAEHRERPLIGNEPGVIGYWKLDEGSGDLMVDSSLGCNDGVIAGGRYRLDSGLALRIGRAVDSPQRYGINGRAQSTGGVRHALAGCAETRRRERSTGRARAPPSGNAGIGRSGPAGAGGRGRRSARAAALRVGQA